MGQISIPAINKTGYSMYWNSMWDDKYNYSRLLKEDIYIREFIPILFDDNTSSNINYLIRKSKYTDFNYLNNKYNLQIQSDFNKNEINNYLRDFNKMIFYFSKIWIIKYQTWVLIFFYIYSPFLSIFLKKNEPEDNKIDDSNYYNILSNYYFSIAKINYSYNFFKKSFRKSDF